VYDFILPPAKMPDSSWMVLFSLLGGHETLVDYIRLRLAILERKLRLWF